MSDEPATDRRDPIDSRRVVDEMVPIAFAPDPICAHLLCALLNSRDVEAHVVGEHASVVGPLGGQSTVSVQVRRDDYARGVLELETLLKERSDDPTVPQPSRCVICDYDLRGLDLQREIVCPECGLSAGAYAASRMRQWVNLAPRPRDPKDSVPTADDAFRAVGVTIGKVVLGGVIAAVLALLTWLAVTLWR